MFPLYKIITVTVTTSLSSAKTYILTYYTINHLHIIVLPEYCAKFWNIVANGGGNKDAG